MPSPRQIAEQKNDRSKFEQEPNDESINPTPREPDYSANPPNPPEPPAPLKITNNG